jgi:two-component system CheB/CheR fusion protein
MNEELQTVNAELQGKVDELSRANNDLQNLLNSTQIATLFLDRAMRVRRFTVQATRIIKLISGDVGRPVTDIASDVLYQGLAEDVHEVLRTLAPSEKEIGTPDGRWFIARVMPYRTVEDVIDGVVITFADITASKVLEGELRGTRERFGALIENFHNTGVSILDETGQTVPRKEALVRITQAKAVDLVAWKMVPTANASEREASE